MAVADVWDALTCDRPYRKAMGTGEAAGIIARGIGQHFDAGCATALFAELGLEPGRSLDQLPRAA